MTFTLMLGCLAAGVAVSNERGVFVPPHGLREAFAATARAFAAIAAPPGQLQLQPYNLLFSPGSIEPYRLPNVIAQRIINPSAPPANAFPGVFGGPSGAAAPGGAQGNDGAPAANVAIAPSGADGTSGAPGGSAFAPPGAGGFTGVPVPIQDLGTTPTEPGIPPVVVPPIIVPPVVVPPVVVPPIDGPPTGNPTPPVIVPPPGTPNPPPCVGATCQPTVPPCVGTACPPVVPPVINPPVVNPPTSAVPEPANWVMLIVGFGIVGGLQRLVGRKQRRRAV